MKRLTGLSLTAFGLSAAVLFTSHSSTSYAEAAGNDRAGSEQAGHRQLSSLLSDHCMDCHDSATTRGGINLEALLDADPLVRHHADWVNVYQRIVDGDMPPKKSAQPTADERKAMVGLIDQLVMDFDYETVAHPGHEPVRRLTRREYGNTVRDLLGAEIDVEAIFPPEMVGASGFDNSANTLFLQRGLMERYLTAAERAVELALPEDADDTQWTRVIGEEAWKQHAGRKQAESAANYFLPRAYRRPASPSEIKQSLSHYDAAVQRGADHATSLRAMLSNTLISAPFLLRMEAPTNRRLEPGVPSKIGPYALASRLSYFLWASMPDDTLFGLAGEEKPSRRLDDPDVLRSQIDRMLKDPKAISLGTDFASQWLGFTHLGARHRPDPIDMPEFTESLFEAMRMESAHVFCDIVRSDRSLKQIIDADHTFVNEELARFYGWRGIRGDRMRRIEVPDGQRGGFLTHASILMVTAFPDRTSPVVRGNWVLSELLGTPPPPPPPDAGDFSEALEEADLSLERKMQLHSKKASCANCHSRIDPLGLALENFDNHGRWRERREEGGRIRARGALPEGTAFNGPAEFKQALIKSRLDDMNRQIAYKMLSYALGRQLTYTDEHTVRSIAAQVKAADYRARTLIYAIVESPAFRYQQLPESDGEQP